MFNVHQIFNSSKTERRDLKKEYKEHQRNKVEAREVKDKAKAQAKTKDSYSAVCFDLQKVLCTPRGKVSTFYYNR